MSFIYNYLEVRDGKVLEDGLAGKIELDCPAFKNLELSLPVFSTPIMGGGDQVNYGIFKVTGMRSYNEWLFTEDWRRLSRRTKKKKMLQEETPMQTVLFVEKVPVERKIETPFERMIQEAAEDF